MIELFKLVKLNDIPDFLKKEMLVTNFDGGFYQKNYEDGLGDEFKVEFTKYFSSLIGKNITISIGWMNFTSYEGLENSFHWHDENGVNGDIFSEYENSCVFWLAGEKGKGGQFRYIDLNDNINVVDLDPPSFMIIRKDTLHSVESYYSQQPRVSFNFNFE